MNTIKKASRRLTSRQPTSLKQLNERLSVEYCEIFPYGIHKDHLVANVVKTDPNYIVWWNSIVIEFPIEPSIVKAAIKNYKHLPKAKWNWQFPEDRWDDFHD